MATLLKVQAGQAQELLKVPFDFGGGYNRHAAKLTLAELEREHGSEAVT